MITFTPVTMHRNKARVSMYKVLVFTCRTYEELIKERGGNYVLDLFTEVCRDNNSEFIGLEEKDGYLYCILSLNP